jgi:nicotinamidase-related amidase
MTAASALPRRPALVPVDMQRAFGVPPWGGSFAAVDARGGALLAAWRDAGQPVLHVRHDSVNGASPLHAGSPGHAFREGFAPRPDEPLIAKSVNCAFIGTDLELRLRRLHVDAVVFFGFTTDRCVSTTARIASNLGFATWVAGDACAAFDVTAPDGRMFPAELVHAVHLATIAAEFGRVADTGALVAQVAASGAAPAFAESGRPC